MAKQSEESKIIQELLASHELDREGPGFLEWLANRLVVTYGESPNVDFVICLRRRAKLAEQAIQMATKLGY